MKIKDEDVEQAANLLADGTRGCLWLVVLLCGSALMLALTFKVCKWAFLG